VALVAAVAIGLTAACGDNASQSESEVGIMNDSEQPTTWEFDPTPRPPLLEERLLEASLVVTGVGTRGDGESWTVTVDEVLLGPDPLPGSLSVLPTDGMSSPASGVWILGSGDPAPVLVDPANVDIDAVRRVLSGQSSILRGPSPEELRRLVDQADVVVFGSLEQLSADVALLRPEEFLKGSVDGDVEVRLDPGRSWTVPPGPPIFGVVFLESSGDGWAVLNPQRPTVYLLRSVQSAVGE
jgi:hypothetical protein